MYRLKLNRGGAISTMAAGGGLALIGKLIRLSDLGLYAVFSIRHYPDGRKQFFRFTKAR